MYTVKTLPEFDKWLNGLKDRMTKQRLIVRLRKAALGNLGDVKPVGEGVSERRIDFGPGYRVYFGQDGQRLVILLLGGTKKRQQRDIAQAKAYWRDYKQRKERR